MNSSINMSRTTISFIGLEIKFIIGKKKLRRMKEWGHPVVKQVINTDLMTRKGLLVIKRR